MKGKTTFLEFPLDKELYEAKSAKIQKEPLHVLVTESGNKISYCLLYQICKGAAFGHDREVVLHLVNSKGTFDHKSILLELEDCGFHLLKGKVVTSNPSEVYKDVDVAIIILAAEEFSGFSFSENVTGLILKLRQLARNLAEYCKPDVKVVVASPSTKSAMLTMHVLKIIEPSIPSQNLTAVTLLDEAIAVAQLAAKLKTTTDRIRDVIIWGLTCPDVHNATVRMFPPGDRAAWEMADVPVAEALEDDKWLRDQFVECIYRRVIKHELVRSGKSLATAITRHVKALFRGQEGRFVSMGVLAPEDDAYLIPRGTPFSFPVTSKNGNWQIVQNLKYDVRTHLCILKTLHRLQTEPGMHSIYRTIDYILDYEETRGEMMHVGHRHRILDMMDLNNWDIKFFLTPLPEEALPRPTKERHKTRKSIAWEDDVAPKKEKLDSRRKSSLRFSFEDTRRSVDKTRGSILKNPFSSEKLLLQVGKKESIKNFGFK